MYNIVIYLFALNSKKQLFDHLLRVTKYIYLRDDLYLTDVTSWEDTLGKSLLHEPYFTVAELSMTKNHKLDVDLLAKRSFAQCPPSNLTHQSLSKWRPHLRDSCLRDFHLFYDRFWAKFRTHTTSCFASQRSFLRKTNKTGCKENASYLYLGCN